MICPTETANDEILVDYCAGTLDTDRAAEFARHMQACEACRRVVEAQSEVWGALDSWTPVEVSPDFDARLYARIAQESAAPPWKQWLRGILPPAVPFPLWQPAVPLAAVCAVMAAGLLVHAPQFSLHHPPHPSNTSTQIG